MEYKLKTSYEQLLADTITPVSIYLRIRDIFPNSLLLEGSEYQSRDNNVSYICCHPLAGIKLHKGKLECYFPDGQRTTKSAVQIDLRKEVSAFRKAFAEDESLPADLKVIPNGLFGYFTFDCIQFFEDITLNAPVEEAKDIPYMQYHVYKYVIAIDHFRNEMHLFEHSWDGQEKSELDKIKYLIQNKNVPEYGFSLEGMESSNRSDQEFRELVEQVKKHVFLGDVFQIVPSRAFSQRFAGDEFNVYRALRSINPSPYLFYFDYGEFKLFGSSPEAQLTIKGREATLFPIAGTFRRSGNMEEDLRMAERLKDDPKESAEHVMLVDLARNDLSRHGEEVTVKSYKEAQFYSHVIHLVSKVTAQLKLSDDSFAVVGDTFPAGTLSGAPKHKAIQLIDQYENFHRGFYSGAVGYMGFRADFNHAIMIRSFLSKNNVLHYQAGAGVVAASDPDNELQEVNNKIAALRKALQLAETL